MKSQYTVENTALYTVRNKVYILVNKVTDQALAIKVKNGSLLVADGTLTTEEVKKLFEHHMAGWRYSISLDMVGGILYKEVLL